jgi:hypothetical protein
LGLPSEIYEPDKKGDFTATDTLTGSIADACSNDANSFTIWFCDLDEKGAPGSGARYCSSGCLQMQSASPSIWSIDYWDVAADTTRTIRTNAEWCT